MSQSIHGFDRRLSNALSEDELDKALESRPITAYCGVDPTAPSLHLGNLMTLMPLIHLLARTQGHTVIAVVPSLIKEMN